MFTWSSSCLRRCNWASSCLLWSSNTCIRASKRPLCWRSSFASAKSSESLFCGPPGEASLSEGGPFWSLIDFSRSYSSWRSLLRATEKRCQRVCDNCYRVVILHRYKFPFSYKISCNRQHSNSFHKLNILCCGSNLLSCRSASTFETRYFKIWNVDASMRPLCCPLAQFNFQS